MAAEEGTKILDMKYDDAHISYKDLMRRYQDRIPSGSDALIARPERSESALQFIERFLGDEEVFYKLADTNYMDYMTHGMKTPNSAITCP